MFLYWFQDPWKRFAIFVPSCSPQYASNSCSAPMQRVHYRYARITAHAPNLAHMTNTDKSVSQPRSYEELSELVKKQEEHIYRLTRSVESQQKRAREVLLKTPLGVLVVNDQQKIEAVNPNIETLFEYTREELFEKRFNF